MRFRVNHCGGADLPINAFMVRGGRLATLEGGGGDGGSANPDTRYANLDRLYGVQSQASQYMLDNAMPQIPNLTANSAGMVNDAMNGTLSKQLGEQAGNNATATMGASLDANNRNMQRFGMGFSANRLLSENNRNAIMGAGLKAGEMNKASMFAEDQKWNRNANFYGQVMGMNNGAMQGINSAGAGLNAVNAQQTQNAQANAAGYGQAGAAFANGLFKARGGYIDGESRRIEEKPVHMASGGDAWAAYKAANPAISSVNTGGGRRSSGFAQMLGGAAPQVLGAGLKDIFKGDKSKILEWGKKGAEYVKGQYNAATAPPASEFTVPQETGFEGIDLNYSGTGEAMDTAVNGWGGVEGGISGLGAAASNVGAGADVANTATTYAAPVADTMAGVETAAVLAARGGQVKKPGLRMALGGLAKSTMAESDKLDKDTVSSLDASNNMQVAKVAGVANSLGTKETHAKPVVDTQYSGNTEGQGDSSDGDKDGFGKHTADYRGVVGKAAINYIPVVGPIIGALNAALGNPIHEVMEPVTRNAISTGDELGGVSGAMVHDPVGASLSGKYKPQELVAGSVAVGLGMPWAGKFFANGGLNDARQDMTPGGHVQGPGTETSDSIPAHLSDGEIVENADTVDLAGKEVLLKINDEGLKVRDGKKTAGQAKKAMGLAMIKRGKELTKKGS